MSRRKSRGNNGDDAGPPEVSIIILNWNKSALTLSCLKSLRQHTRSIGVEIIVVDNGSNPLELAALKNGMDPDVHLISLAQNMFLVKVTTSPQKPRGATYYCFSITMRFPSDIAKTWSFNSRNAFQRVRLNQDFKFPNGAIQEAGGFLLPSGVSFRGGEMDFKVDPHFESGNHVVDYCSAACLLVERQAFMKVGGFDPLFDPASYEDCDLCLRLRSLGLYTYYASDIEVFHEENATSSELWET